MDSTLLAAIQEWHTFERQNCAAYDALSARADAINWPGLAKWLAKAAGEEREHAAKIAGYLVDKNATPEYAALDSASAPQSDDHADFFKAALVRETLTDETIKEIYQMACEQGEYDAAQFMLWFLEEQRRSIRTITDYLKMLSRPVDRLVFDNALA